MINKLNNRNLLFLDQFFRAKKTLASEKLRPRSATSQSWRNQNCCHKRIKFSLWAMGKLRKTATKTRHKSGCAARQAQSVRQPLVEFHPFRDSFSLLLLVVEKRARHREYGSSYRRAPTISSNIRLRSPQIIVRMSKIRSVPKKGSWI